MPSDTFLYHYISIMFGILAFILIVWAIAGATDAGRRFRRVNLTSPQWEYRLALSLFFLGFYFIRLIALVEYQYAPDLWVDALFATLTTGTTLLAAYTWIKRRFAAFGQPQPSGPMKEHPDGSVTYGDSE